MKGGFLHNEILIAPLERAFLDRGAEVTREGFVHTATGSGFVDLLVTIGGLRLAVEAERSVRRVPFDLVKAAAADVDELWLVVPDASLARTVRTRLRAGLTVPACPAVFVLTQGCATRRVTDCFPLNSSPNVPRTTNQKQHREP